MKLFVQGKTENSHTFVNSGRVIYFTRLQFCIEPDLITKSEGIMNILQAQIVAKKFSVNDTITFDLVGPISKMKCEWLDQFLGLFKIDGFKGAFRVNSFAPMDNISVKNLKVFCPDGTEIPVQNNLEKLGAIPK